MSVVLESKPERIKVTMLFRSIHLSIPSVQLYIQQLSFYPLCYQFNNEPSIYVYLPVHNYIHHAISPIIHDLSFYLPIDPFIDIPIHAFTPIYPSPCLPACNPLSIHLYLSSIIVYYIRPSFYHTDLSSIYYLQLRMKLF